ncbi:hypothetical protein NKR23_g11725 [Pleurostoma richardsiae]|uniref:Uncharacterized protein n=1 Tax=Pleurostoma richardsiae TaxID=41990 RepID=A0AA38R9V9_9PEZI|nr:hypothetical protein NKR23_g11725 [Pleurostoma richardsiae]
MGTAPGQTRLSDLWNTTRTQRHRAVSPPLALEEPDVVDPGAAGRATMLAVIDKTNGDPDGRKFVIHCALADVKRVTHWIAPQSSRRKVRVLGKGRGEMPVEQLEALVKAGFSPLTIEIQSEECPGQGCEQA